MYNSCFVSNKILVKPTIQTNDLEMNFKDGSAFKTFVTTNEGKPVGAGENVPIKCRVDKESNIIVVGRSENLSFTSIFYYSW